MFLKLLNINFVLKYYFTASLSDETSASDQEDADADSEPEDVDHLPAASRQFSTPKGPSGRPTYLHLNLLGKMYFVEIIS